MLGLDLNTAELHTIGTHRYYLFPAPPTHSNQRNRPSTQITRDQTTQYTGRGAGNDTRLHPDVHNAVGALMGALLDYGVEIDDYSINSCSIQNGWRPNDTEEVGVHYYENIQAIMGTAPFRGLTFPQNLISVSEQSLGNSDDPRFIAFRDRLAASGNGWNRERADSLLNAVAQVYVPRGAFNPHTSGLVFDVDFNFFHHIWRDGRPVSETDDKVNALPGLNEGALRSACGMWLNKHSMHYNFDSYDTGKEVWHMEWRRPR
jgi:hypothetical protein